MHRQGVTLIEITAALSVMGLAMIAAAQIHALTSLQMLRNQQQNIALHEASNLVEQLSAMSYDQLTEERVAAISLSGDTARRLPQASLSIAVQDMPGDLPARRYRLRLQWRTGSGATNRSIELSGWKYQTVAEERSE
jgi:prepilin-type N-terminal cleavage/methylation domain-containing protein